MPNGNRGNAKLSHWLVLERRILRSVGGLHDGDLLKSYNGPISESKDNPNGDIIVYGTNFRPI